MKNLIVFVGVAKGKIVSIQAHGDGINYDPVFVGSAINGELQVSSYRFKEHGRYGRAIILTVEIEHGSPIGMSAAYRDGFVGYLIDHSPVNGLYRFTFWMDRQITYEAYAKEKAETDAYLYEIDLALRRAIERIEAERKEQRRQRRAYRAWLKEQGKVSA